MEKLAENIDFVTYITTKEIILRFIYKRLMAIVFSDYRNTVEKKYLKEKNNGFAFIKIITNIIFMISSSQNGVIELLAILKTEPDILMRAFYFIAKIKEHYSAINMAFTIINVIKSDEYEYPPFCNM